MDCGLIYVWGVDQELIHTPDCCFFNCFCFSLRERRRRKESTFFFIIFLKWHVGEGPEANSPTSLSSQLLFKEWVEGWAKLPSLYGVTRGCVSRRTALSFFFSRLVLFLLFSLSSSLSLFSNLSPSLLSISLSLSSPSLEVQEDAQSSSSSGPATAAPGAAAAERRAPKAHDMLSPAAAAPATRNDAGAPAASRCAMSLEAGLASRTRAAGA